MSDQKVLLTKEKFEELQAELENLTKVKRKEVADLLEATRSQGDLKENAEYHEARDQQADLERRIAELEATLQNAEIVKHRKTGVVQVGSTVTVRKGKERTDKDFTIVSSEEANVLEGRISYQSPVGAALMDKAKDDTVTIKAPSGDVDYKIINVK